jgi:hypothetical protein
MNRRSMFNSLLGIPAMAVSAVAPARAESFAYTRVTHCAKCGGKVVYMTSTAIRRIVMCPDPKCDNNWPWIQERDSAVRVTGKVRHLLIEKSILSEIIHGRNTELLEHETCREVASIRKLSCDLEKTEISRQEELVLSAKVVMDRAAIKIHTSNLDEVNSKIFRETGL